MSDLPGFSFMFSRWPEVALVAFMFGAIAGVLLAWIVEKAAARIRAWWIARRNERLLEAKRTEIKMSRAMKDAHRFGWLPREWL